MSAALDLLLALVLEDGRRWGEAAVPFQWEDAAAVLDQSSPTPYSFLTRARGASKTADLAGVAMAAMVAQAPAGARLYALAADRDQGRLLLDSIEGYRRRTPELAGAVVVEAYQVSAPRSGAVLEVLAADAPGAWGLRPWLAIVDEIAQWPSTDGALRLWEAVSTAAAKLADARMVLLTSAGDPAHWSRRVLDHAYTDPLWRVHEVSGPAPWMDEARLAEQRRRLSESSFARLFENVWTAGEDRLTTLEDLDACVTLDGPVPPKAGKRYALGVDVGLKNDATAIAVCHLEAVEAGVHGAMGVEMDVDEQAEMRAWFERLGNPAVQRGLSKPRRPRPVTRAHRVVLDRLQVFRGSRLRPVQLRDVEDWVTQAARDYNRARCVFDPYQAVGSMQRLQARGVRVEEWTFSPSSNGKLATTLHRLLRNRALDLPDDRELRDELANVRLRETSPGVYRLDHDAGQHDDRAIALALAATSLLSQPGLGGQVYSMPSPAQRTPHIARRVNR